MSRFKGKILFLFDNILELNHLDRESARAAIIKPLGEYNAHQVIAESLLDHRLTVLSGDSGAGKSRILKQGIAPHLYQITQQQPSEGQDFVESTLVFFDSWRKGSTNELLQTIVTALQKTFPDIQISSKSDNLLELLKACSHLVQRSGKNHTLLIVLDQFEEYFRDSSCQAAI